MAGPTDTGTLVRPDVVGPMLVKVTGDERWSAPTASLITGGKSNLTYRLSSPAGELILRRPPSGSILATAHDMGREARVQRALAATDVPVAPIVLVDDGAAIGVPFYVMAAVPGHVIRGELPPGFATGNADRSRLSHALVDTLAGIHAIDPQTVGLGDYGRPDGFLQRQVRRWQQQWSDSSEGAVPAMDELAARLADRFPTSPRATIVHGDFRLDNCIVATDDPGRIAAVLDWELSTLGDPLTDLAMLLFYSDGAGRLFPELVPTVSALPGFAGPNELANRWSLHTGVPIDELPWYRAFAHFKFAGIAQGVQARARAGAMGGQDFGDVDASIVATAEAGLALLS